MLLHQPHPFPNRPPLEGQALWVLENEIREVKDRPKPVELVGREVSRSANVTADKRGECEVEGNNRTGYPLPPIDRGRSYQRK